MQSCLSPFGEEAMRLAVDVINLSPSVSLDHNVPQRVWTRIDVSYDYLRVFYCRAFVHVHRDERYKLVSKTRQCIFIGYGREEFKYRFWDPFDKKVIKSRDAVLFEDQITTNFEEPEQPKSSSEELAYTGMIRLPMVPAGDNSDVQIDDPLTADVEPIKENATELSVEPQIMRRSTKEQ